MCCIFKLNMMLKAYFIFTFYFYNFIINPFYPQFKTNTMTMFTNLPIEKNVKISFYCFFFLQSSISYIPLNSEFYLV